MITVSYKNYQFLKLSRVLGKLKVSAKSGSIQRGMEEAGKMLQKYIRLSMKNTPRSDRIYKRGGSIHRPSKPFHPPAIDSGNLWSKILVDSRPKQVEVGAQADAYYATYLEHGTSKMEKRPFIYPAYKNNIEKIKSMIKKNIQRDIT